MVVWERTGPDWELIREGVVYVAGRLFQFELSKQGE